MNLKLESAISVGLIFTDRKPVEKLSSYRGKPSREDVFRSVPVPSALRIMILPSVISQLIVLIYNMADTFHVGQTNNPDMVAATSLILPVFNICLCLAGLAGVGCGSLISRLLGQGRDDEARRVGVFSIYLGLAVAVLFAVLIRVFMRPLLGLLGADEHTYEYARQYAMCVIVAGGIPTVLSNVLSNLLRSVGRSGAAGFGIILGCVLNITLDPVFMFVLLPNGLEVFGAGAATLPFKLHCLRVLLRRAVHGQEGLDHHLQPRVGMASRESILAVFAVGLPSAVTSFLFDLDYVILDKLMVSYHNTALAAIGIVLKVERFPLNAGVGICQGMMPLVGYNYSAGNRRRLRDIIRMSLTVGLVIAAVSILLYELFAAELVRVFLDDSRTERVAALQFTCWSWSRAAAGRARRIRGGTTEFITVFEGSLQVDASIRLHRASVLSRRASVKALEHFGEVAGAVEAAVRSRFRMLLEGSSSSIFAPCMTLYFMRYCMGEDAERLVEAAYTFTLAYARGGGYV